MIKCNSLKGFYGRCVIDMDSMQTQGETFCCDIAEECEFRREKILINCEHAEPADIKDEALKELFE